MVQHFEFILYVSDQKISTSFYTKVLRRQPDLNVPGMTEFNLSDSCKLGLMPANGIAKILKDKTRHPNEGNGIPRCELYFLTEDLEIEFSNVKALNISIVSYPEDHDWGDRVFYFSDPDGHIVAFAQKIS